MSKVGERGERLLSPELQAQRIEGYARQHGLSVEMLDPELDISGGTLERPILSAALERIDRGEAAGIIVAQLDRLSRAGIYDTLPVLQRVEDAGGAVIAVAEDFDTATPEGRMARNVMLSLGAMQREQRGRGFEQARRSAIARGIWPAARVPIGYVKDETRTLTPDPAKAAIVEQAFEARAQGASWKAVGEILGVAAGGAQWVIANRVYLGEVRMSVGGEPVVNPDAHEPIVGRALWEAAQLEHPRPPRGESGPALLSGLIRCASCERAMSPTRRSYNCTIRVPCEEPASILRSRVEPYVEGLILSHLRTLSFTASREDDLARAMDALADAEAELEAFQQATSASGVGVEAFAEGLRARVSAVEEARGVVGRSRGTGERVATMLEVWSERDVAWRRHVLRGLLDVVWVRSAHRRNLPVAERVKVVEAGFRVSPVGWGELPGEVVPPVEGGEDD